MNGFGRFSLGDPYPVLESRNSFYLNPFLGSRVNGAGWGPSNKVITATPFITAFNRRVNRVHFYIGSALASPATMYLGIYHNKPGKFYPGKLFWTMSLTYALYGNYHDFPEAPTGILIPKNTLLWWAVYMNGQMSFGASGNTLPWRLAGMLSANNLYSTDTVLNIGHIWSQSVLGPLPNPFPNGAGVGGYNGMMDLHFYVV